MNKTSFAVAFICLILILTACQAQAAPIPASTSAPTSTPLAPTQPSPASTATPQPSLTPTPTPFHLQAVVWESDPIIPILNYHRFTPNSWDETSGMVVYLGDLQNDLQTFYDSGYSLISLDDLLNGEIRVPPGRRPLILTIDDAYFANQFALDEHGQVSQLTAVGVIRKFSEDHPDFGFEIAMFANFGDKYYGNLFTGTWWYLAEGWEEALAHTIVWGIEHHVIPYNHTFRHPHLDQLADEQILPQLKLNDEALREYLAMAGHPEYASRLSNYIALPYGSWPASENGRQTVKTYVNPEGSPVRAVFEAGYEYKPSFAKAPFSTGFDPMHLPRMAAIWSVIKHITDLSPSFPTAQSCQLSVDSADPTDQAVLNAIQQQISAGVCPEGVYILSQDVFIARGGTFQRFVPAH